MADAKNWPMVPAGPGFEVLDERFPNADGEPVLAWRVGDRVTLPVTRQGFKAKAAWIAYPDGTVMHHDLPGPSAVPDYVSRDAWARDLDRQLQDDDWDARPSPRGTDHG
jgi:hypothetical protein